MDPTLAGFLGFIRNYMRIPTAVLPDDSPFINWAYQFAILITNQALQVVGAATPDTWSYYARAVYNLAGHTLVETAPDVTNAPPVEGGTLPYFANLRDQMDLNSFVSGAIQSASDQGTGESMVVPEAMKNLTFADLQTMKTPWGRTYMGLAQAYGSEIWGIS